MRCGCWYIIHHQLASYILTRGSSCDKVVFVRFEGLAVVMMQVQVFLVLLCSHILFLHNVVYPFPTVFCIYSLPGLFILFIMWREVGEMYWARDCRIVCFDTAMVSWSPLKTVLKVCYGAVIGSASQGWILVCFQELAKRCILIAQWFTWCCVS
jgi:hypothetical protein